MRSGGRQAAGKQEAKGASLSPAACGRTYQVRAVTSLIPQVLLPGLGHQRPPRPRAP